MTRLLQLIDLGLDFEVFEMFKEIRIVVRKHFFLDISGSLDNRGVGPSIGIEFIGLLLFLRK